MIPKGLSTLKARVVLFSVASGDSMPSSVGSRVLPTSCQLLTLGSRRRPILYRPGSTRGGRKGPVHLSGAILIGRNAAVQAHDCGNIFSRIVGKSCIVAPALATIAQDLVSYKCGVGAHPAPRWLQQLLGSSPAHTEKAPPRTPGGAFSCWLPLDPKRRSEGRLGGDLVRFLHPHGEG